MTKPPPVPPQNQSHKGTGDTKSPQTQDAKPGIRENLREQGRQGNIHQNTTNQGYQQDR